MEDTSSRTSALEELLRLLPETRAELSDHGAAALLTKDFVSAVFSEAWRSQYTEDRDDFRKKLRDIVSDAIAAMKLSRKQ